MSERKSEQTTSRRSGSADLRSLDEERALIQRLQAGDRTAFSDLYAWYGDLVWRQAILPRLPNRELAEDCLRDTFRTALEKIGSYELIDRSIYFWLHRIGVNKAIDIHRRHKRDRKLADAVRAEGAASLSHQPPQPDRGLEIDDTHRMVNASLSKLNERYASALRMRLIEDRSREECASILGITMGNFDVILHRASKAFRKVFPP